MFKHLARNMCGEENGCNQVESSSGGDNDVDKDGNFSDNTAHDQQDSSIYVLSRSLTTVHEVWREWDKGLRTGEPAVKDMEAKYKASWRSSAKGKDCPKIYKEKHLT